MSFSHLSYESTIKLPTPVTSAVKLLNLGHLGGGDLTGLAIVCETTDFTVGSCVMSVWSSHDGSTWRDMGTDQSVTITADGFSYVQLNGAYSEYLRLVFTPSGGFDGVISPRIRSSHSISLDVVEA